MGQNPIVALGAGVLLIVALIWIVMNVFDINIGGPEGASDDVFWYDEGESELYGALPNQYGPIVAPSGGDGVRAYVFTNSTCEDDRYIGYLEKYSDPEKMKGASDMITRALLEQARLLRRPDSQEWVFAGESEEGQQIQADYPNPMGSKNACPQYMD
jgi:hypothetical protein